MNTISDRDEARLRARVRTIAEAIGDCHDEGRADLLAPRRSHRYGVTVAVAAAAVLVLIAVAVLVSRGGDATTTRVADGSGVLDGLELGPTGSFALVDTPRGIVVVVADHNGGPAVYAPLSDGRHHWLEPAVDEPYSVTGVRAWRDGSSVRILEDLAIDCDDPEVTAYEVMGHCSPKAVSLTRYQIGAGELNGGGLMVGAKLHFLASERALVAAFDPDSAIGHETQLAVLDERAMGLASYPSQLSKDTKACGSNGTFVFAEPDDAVQRLSVFVRPISDGSPLPPPVSKQVPLTGDPLTDGTSSSVSVVGCIDAGMVVESRSRVTGSRWLSVVHVENGGDAMSIRRLPAGPFQNGNVEYSVDAMGTAVVARRHHASNTASTKDDIAVLPTTGRWRVLGTPVPGGAQVAVHGESANFIVRPHGADGHILQRLT